ncbi:MAG: hypothetical protein ABIG43_02770 [Chloroflexota bacterium]
MYFLGIAIANYLGNKLNWSLFSVGLFLNIAIQLSDSIISNYVKNSTNKPGNDGQQQNKKADRKLILLAGLALILTLDAVLIVLLLQTQQLNLTAWVLLLVILIISILKSLPMINNHISPYSEIIEGILIVGLVPAFSLVLQFNELHRLLMMSTIPLLFVYLASRLASGFSSYAQELEATKRSMLILIGWHSGMFLHNLFLLLGFLALGLACLFGLPWEIVWPVLLTLPLVLFQIWQLLRISQGCKPNWRLLKICALALFGITSYMLIFTFMTN